MTRPALFTFIRNRLATLEEALWALCKDVIAKTESVRCRTTVRATEACEALDEFLRPTVFRDLDDVVEAFGEYTVSGVCIVHAATDDGITHRARLYIQSRDNMAIQFDCRPLLIDGHGDALAHLRAPEVLVDCMTCLVAASGTPS